MHRQIVYIGQIPQDTDQLLQNRNTMVGLGFALSAILGTNTQVDGLACTPNSPAALNVLVAPGSIYSLQNVDSTAYGSLTADTIDQIIKQGISQSTLTLSCPAPGTTGQSVVYLIQAAYQDIDGGSTVLPYYNASNPASAWSGPNNTGISQNTVRQGVCTVNAKTGVAATTGTQTTPAPDAGFIGLYAVTVANGQSTITSGDIVQLATAPFITPKLPSVLSTMQAGAANYAADTSGAANTITIAPSPAIAALTNGLTLRVKIANTNTGATVMNTNGLGNVSVVTANGAALASGSLVANGIYEFVYDANGTRWQVQSTTTAVSTPTGYFYGATTAGTANAQTLASVTPSGYTLSAGNLVAFTAGATNTGATTLSVNSTTATAVNVNTPSGLAALTGGEIQSGQDYIAYYDGTRYVLVDPSAFPSAAFATKSQMQAATDTAHIVNPAQVQNHPGVAKAWCSFTGATGAILNSYNIASITRNSTGDYTVAFTTAMATGNYVVMIQAGGGSSVTNSGSIKTGTTPTTGGFTFNVTNVTATPALVDEVFVQFTVFGNQ